MVFRLPLRQTEGFLDSLLRLMEFDLRAPDHTTLSRRNKDVDVPHPPCPTRAHDGALHLIVDSTGLKISGAGEWHAHRHKSSKARRQWRKTANIKIVIPPRRGAVPSDGAEGTWAQRNATLETIRNVGRQGWQRESGYRRQGAVENLFFRYKRTLGNSLRARGYESQRREARIGCNVLNRMAELGKPESQAIVGE